MVEFIKLRDKVTISMKVDFVNWKILRLLFADKSSGYIKVISKGAGV